MITVSFSDKVIRNSGFLVALLIVFLVPVVLVSIFVIALLSFHVYLIISGKTTKETVSKNVPLVLPDQQESNIKQLQTNLVPDVSAEQERIDTRKPYLFFAMELTREEVDYLTSFELCLCSV